jgi:hypothetical protein
MASLDFISSGVAGTGFLDADTTIGRHRLGELTLIANAIGPLVMDEVM